PQAQASARQVGDLSHRDIITRGNVECFERATSRFAGEEHGGYDVGDMDIRFALPAVPRMRSLVGSWRSRRTKSNPMPWVCRRPTTLPKRKTRPRISNMEQ